MQYAITWFGLAGAVAIALLGSGGEDAGSRDRNQVAGWDRRAK